MSNSEPIKISIFGYENNLVQPWDDSTPEKRSLPGSEEAIIYLSRELVKLGFIVKIWADPPHDSKFLDSKSNPRYFFASEFNSYNHDDEIVICWRVYASKSHFNSRLRINWSHDIAGKFYPSSLITPFDGVLWLSKWQRQNYYEKQGLWAKIPSVILGNGWTPINNYPLQDRPPRSCIYGSNWSRGLENVLDSWVDVRQKYPDATLTICYGHHTWGVWSSEKEEQVLERVEKMCQENLGITNAGSVDHITLEKLYNEHSLWIYPNSDKETFCITALKAQGGGCIPVATRKEGLETTLAPFSKSCKIIEEWKPLLMKTLENADKININERQKYINFAHEWQWSNVAKRLQKFLKENIKN